MVCASPTWRKSATPISARQDRPAVVTGFTARHGRGIRELTSRITTEWQKRIRFAKFLERFTSWRVKVSDHYTYRVTWSPDDCEHVGLCLEFPSLSWLAQTPEEAFTGIRRLVAEVVVDMRGSDESPPVPLADRAYSGKFIVRVPPETHRELMLEAAEERVSLNRLVSARLSRSTAERT